jgi:3-oxoacyl-[acyl-carrier protein] reductase
MSAEPRVVLVSGASAGLGAALVEHFLTRGDTVAAFSRRRNDAIEGHEQKHGAGGRFFWQSVDAADLPSIRAFVRDVLRRYGHIDALVNNAGVGVQGLLTLTSDEELTHAVNVNLSGSIALTRACLKGMLAAKRGSIVSVSSVNALRGHKGLSVYSATKAALHGFTRSLAREVGPQNIRVNAIAPGYFESAMVEHISPEQKATIVRRTPLRRLTSMEDLVGALEFLLSAPAITGQVLAVDGGYSC